MTSKETTPQDAMEQVLRAHRHDVMNHLQVCKGYLQLGKADRAMEALNRCAEWLQALSRWQEMVGDGDPQLLYAAYMAPHLQVDCEPANSDVRVSEQGSTEGLVRAIQSAETCAAEHGKMLHLTIGYQMSGYQIVIANSQDQTYLRAVCEKLARAVPDIHWLTDESAD